MFNFKLEFFGYSLNCLITYLLKTLGKDRFLFKFQKALISCLIYFYYI